MHIVLIYFILLRGPPARVWWNCQWLEWTSSGPFVPVRSTVGFEGREELLPWSLYLAHLHRRSSWIIVDAISWETWEVSSDRNRACFVCVPYYIHLDPLSYAIIHIEKRDDIPLQISCCRLPEPLSGRLDVSRREAQRGSKDPLSANMSICRVGLVTTCPREIIDLLWIYIYIGKKDEKSI